MRKIEVVDGRIRLHTHYDDRHKAASLPGARWLPMSKCWSMPATPGVARLVVLAFKSTAAELPPESVALRKLLKQHARRRCIRDELTRQEVEQDYESASPYPPWAHQVRATRFIRDMDAALLHAWMGTGKTRIALDACRARGDHRILVVCPVSALDVWSSEIDKHAPGAWEVLCLGSSKSVAERAELLRWRLTQDKPLLAAVNYEAHWRSPLAETILGQQWNCVIYDESHRLKSPGSLQSRFATRLRACAEHRVCLTGTVMPHSPLDVYGQYRFLDPGIFGTRFAPFRDRYAVMGGYENKQVLGFRRQDELRERMDKLRLHIGKDVLDLPPLQFLDRGCSLEPKARKIYDDLDKQFVADVQGGIVTVANALSRLLRLQQLTSGWLPRNNDPEDMVQVSTAKRNLLRELLEDICPEPVVVFCRFRRDLEVVHREVEKVGQHCGEISGARNDYKSWIDGEYDTLAVQVQAGSEGIDLTRARVGIFYSMGFSLGQYQQCYSRLHRPGQEKPTVIYRLLATGTVDRKVLRALDKRLNVVKSILYEVKGGEA